MLAEKLDYTSIRRQISELAGCTSEGSRHKDCSLLMTSLAVHFNDGHGIFPLFSHCCKRPGSYFKTVSLTSNRKYRCNQMLEELASF